jgi:hypothetical protein
MELDDTTTSMVKHLNEISMIGNNSTSLENEFEFNHRLLLNVIAYSIMFVVGTIGNTIVFIAARRQHKSPENHGRTNVHMMVLHLTIADLVRKFIFIGIFEFLIITKVVLSFLRALILK